jgi:hypothetical protein
VSASSLDTQFGDDGHDARRESLTPSLVGRVPAQEKSGMTMTMAAMMLGRAFNDVDYVKTSYSFFCSPACQRT